MSIEVGQEAPDFTLKNQAGEEVSLSSFRGEKNVVVMFFPAAFTGICTGEVCAVRDAGIEGDDTVVLGISCDHPASLKVFAEQQHLSYTLLSDFWPHGAVSTQYGVFVEERGFAKRGTFIIDKQGVVRWLVVNSPADARDTAEYKQALADLA